MLRSLLGRLRGTRARAIGAGLPVPRAASLDRMPQRLEEAVAYFAARTNPHHYAPSAFLGGQTALGLLHGRHPIYLDTRGTDVAPHIMLFGIWEPNYTSLFQRLIRPGDTVFDLGAHLGVYSVLGGAATGLGGRLHAFEPNARFAALLRRSMAVNGFRDFATVHNVAVGAAEGRTQLRFSWEYAGGGHLEVEAGPRPANQEAQSCRVVALDDLFPDPAFRVDVMKMDVEGSEAAALRGMTALVRRSPRLRVMFEFAPGLLAAHGSSAAELIGLFDELGFRFWSIAADSSLAPEPAAALAAKADGVVNILAARGEPFGG